MTSTTTTGSGESTVWKALTYRQRKIDMLERRVQNLTRWNSLARRQVTQFIDTRRELEDAIRRKNQFLRDLLSVLGPEGPCTCHAQFCALNIEVAEAVHMLRDHLGLDEPPTTHVEGIALKNVHDEKFCIHRSACVVHRPSDHHMRNWKLHWRGDRGIFERICPHGVGHPDPDQFEYWHEIGRDSEAVHGCDGCCASNDKFADMESK